MKSILLVEDDPHITNLLELHLGAPGYKVICCPDGETAIAEMKEKLVDLVILDIMLPGINGLEVCRHIRASQTDVPIMMLTSKAEESDKVLALELGADDYVTKPFGILELLARTKALLRRTSSTKSLEYIQHKIIVTKDMSIDEIDRRVLVGKRRIDLTPKEFDLLLMLAKNPGRAFTRKQLLERVWGFSVEGYEHTVTAHINRLRIKIEPDINNPQYILTAWGIGYRFVE